MAPGNDNLNDDHIDNNKNLDPALEYLKIVEPFPVEPPTYVSTLPRLKTPSYDDLLPKNEKLPKYTPTVYKLSILYRKVEWFCPFEMASQRHWIPYIVELNNTQINFYQCPFKPDDEIFTKFIASSSMTSNNSHSLLHPYHHHHIYMKRNEGLIAPTALTEDDVNKVNYNENNFRSIMTTKTDLKALKFFNSLDLLQSSKVVRSYTLQYGRIGSCIDYKKKKFVFRCRFESEQFLLDFPNVDSMIEWYNAIDLAIDNSLDLSRRELPKYRTIPRRRRTRRRKKTIHHLSDHNHLAINIAKGMGMGIVSSDISNINNVNNSNSRRGSVSANSMNGRRGSLSANSTNDRRGSLSANSINDRRGSTSANSVNNNNTLRGYVNNNNNNNNNNEFKSPATKGKALESLFKRRTSSSASNTGHSFSGFFKKKNNTNLSSSVNSHDNELSRANHIDINSRNSISHSLVGSGSGSGDSGSISIGGTDSLMSNGSRLIVTREHNFEEDHLEDELVGEYEEDSDEVDDDEDEFNIEEDIHNQDEEENESDDEQGIKSLDFNRILSLKEEDNELSIRGYEEYIAKPSRHPLTIKHTYASQRKIIRDSLRCMIPLTDNENWFGKYILLDVIKFYQPQHKETIGKHYQCLDVITHVETAGPHYQHRFKRPLQEWVVTPSGIIPYLNPNHSR